MDTRFFGSNLVARHDVEASRRAMTNAGEDAYYARHQPAESLRLREVTSVVAAIAVVWFGLAIDAWLR